jgi:hypothetical protein
VIFNLRNFFFVIYSSLWWWSTLIKIFSMIIRHTFFSMAYYVLCWSFFRITHKLHFEQCSNSKHSEICLYRNSIAPIIFPDEGRLCWKLGAVNDFAEDRFQLCPLFVKARLTVQTYVTWKKYTSYCGRQQRMTATFDSSCRSNKAHEWCQIQAERGKQTSAWCICIC